MFYSIRRLVSYLKCLGEKEYSFKEMWKVCNPFNNNATIKRMVLISHSSFCAVNLTDSIVEGIVSGGTAFIMRFNVYGFGRFAVSLWDDLAITSKRYTLISAFNDSFTRKNINEDYLISLKRVYDYYVVGSDMSYMEDLKQGHPEIAFEKNLKVLSQRNLNTKFKTKDDCVAFFENKDGDKKLVQKSQ